jgi:hypothetical protein
LAFNLSGDGGNHSFNLLEVAEVVTGGLGDEILHRQTATLRVDAGTPPVVLSKVGKHPQVGFTEQTELCERFLGVAGIVITKPMPQVLIISGEWGTLFLGNLAVAPA